MERAGMMRTWAKGWWGMIHRGHHSQKHYGRVYETGQCAPDGPTTPESYSVDSEVRFMSFIKHVVILYQKNEESWD